MAQIPGFDEKNGLLSNILAIGGFLILIIILVWGFINLVRIGGSWASSLFGVRANEIRVTVPASVTSGEQFSFMWEYSATAPGSYALLYQCANGFRLETPGVAGASSVIPCGAGFSIGSSTGELPLIPILSDTSVADIPLSVIFTPSATTSEISEAQGSAVLHVAAGTDAPAPSVSSAPTTVVTPASVPALASGSPDLSVRITGVTNDGGMTNVTFDIANSGGSSSGTWYFTAQLPTAQPYTFSSSAQTPLAPGARISNTLRFTGAVSSGGTFSVSVDPGNAVAESNESNNVASQWVAAPYQYQSAPAYNYPTYNYSYSGQYYDPQFIYPNSYRYSYPQYSYPYQYYSNQTPYQYLGSYQYPYSYQY
jgi:hypothetical protein